tara:strand:- start:8172 stop:8294 length:123 start_codon:yes stop_codon:yes gene_type:complete
LEDRLINVCVDAITILKALGHDVLAFKLNERIDRIMGHRA